MIIDFVFEKGIRPWDEIELKSEETRETILLKKTSSRTRRLQVTAGKQGVCLTKKNVWLDGIEEVFFSLDGVFYNTFSAERLPYSVEISLADSSQSQTIRIPVDVVFDTDAKSQNRWKAATVVQSIVFALLLAFCSIVLSLAFKELQSVIVIVGLIMNMLIFAFSFRKVKFLLNLINRCSGC